MTARKNWIDVDLDGFGQLMGSRPKVAILHDLLANVFDEDATTATVTLAPIEGRRGVATLIVEDDCPTGFADLRDAYTLYKASKKKGDPTKRGRFNEGEKFVLSLCESATITTTTGTVTFNTDGRKVTKKATSSGSIFSSIIKVNRNEIAEMLKEVNRIIVPDGFTVTINGELIPRRDPLRSVDAILQTVIADDEGILTRTQRSTTVTLHPTLNGETAYLYEIGIPVVTIDTPWHINVSQKVPLNRDRDNVTPAYRKYLLAAVLTTSVDILTDEQASETWVKDALPAASARAVRIATNKMFGEGWVIATPYDREADKNAIAHGRTVVSGGSLSADAWSSVRDHNAANSSATEYSLKIEFGNRKPDKPDETPFVRSLRAYAESVTQHLLERTVYIDIWDDASAGFDGMFSGSRIVINITNIAQDPNTIVERIDDLMIHECAHHYSDDHLTMKFIDACTMLGAKLKSCTAQWK